MSHSLTALWSYLNTYLLVILTGLAGWAVWEFRVWVAGHMKFLDAQTQAKLAAALDTGLKDAVNYALQLAVMEEAKAPGVKLPGGAKGWVLDKAADYAETHLPVELDSVGLSPEELSQRLLAKLPSPSTGLDTTGVKLPLPTTVTVTELVPPRV